MNDSSFSILNSSFFFLKSSFPSYLLPKYKKNIPISTKIRSTALLFKFFSRKNKAPNRNDTTTLPLRTIDTMDIIESS